MPLIEGGVRNVKEISSRFGAQNGHNMSTVLDSDGNITSTKYYDDSGSGLQYNTYEYASFLSICTTIATTNWTETGDGAVSVTASNWMDSSTTTLTDTYTYSAGSSLLACTTDNGDCSDWIGSGCDEGYVICFMKFSDFVNVTSGELRIGSTNANYRSVTLNSAEAYMADDEWFFLVFDLSTGSDEGTPDGTNLEYTAFNFTITAGTAQTIDVHSIMLAGISATISGETFRDLFHTEVEYVLESKTIDKFYAFDNSQSVYGTITRSGY